MPESSTEPRNANPRFTIRSKIMFSFAIVFVLDIFILLFGYVEIDHAKKLTKSILPYTHQVELLNQLTHSVDSLETQVDTFFITPYAQYWTQAEIDLQDMGHSITQMTETVQPNRIPVLQEMNRALDELTLQIDNLFIKVVEETETSVAKTRITNYEISQLYELIEQTKQQYKDFLLSNTERLQITSAQQYQIMESLLERISLTSAVVFISAIFASLLISESISRPIQLLKKGTDAFAKGAKNIQVQINSNDEVGDLARSFNLMTNTLQTQQDRLTKSKKMESVGLLASGVAHDLNNVLTGIVGYPDLLLMDMASTDPNRKMVKAIQKSGRKAAAIVDDLLTLARRGVTANEVINLNEIVTEYLASPEQEHLRLANRYLRFSQDCQADLGNISGSAVHLKKLLMNLASNAAEAQPDGGLVHIRTENHFLDAPLNGYQSILAGQYAMLAVDDHGQGIAKQDIDRIFEPFFTSKSMGHSGTGLGMSVVLGTVEDHQGYITIDSQLNAGTSIEVYFPVTQQVAPQDRRDVSFGSLQGHGQVILVVDDMESQRTITAQLLQRLNYSVHTASSGEAAIEFLKLRSADLVLLDMIMAPGIDGYETYKRILDIRPGQPCIIVSGYAETESVRKAQDLGAGTFLRKPFQIEELGTAVQWALSGETTA